MQEVFNDGRPDRVTKILGVHDDRLVMAVADPAVSEVRIHKPGSILTIQNGPFKGRRYYINAAGQRVRVRS